MVNEIENKIKQGLRERGIPCHTVYRVPAIDQHHLLLSFSSTSEGDRLTPARVEKALNTLGIGVFRVSEEFHRLSAAFLHLEVFAGKKAETPSTDEAA